MKKYKYKVGDWVTIIILTDRQGDMRKEVQKYVNGTYVVTRTGKGQSNENVYILELGEDKTAWRWSEDTLQFSTRYKLAML